MRLGPVRAAAHRHPVATFTILAYALSWTAWIPVVSGVGGAAGTAAIVLGGFGPALAALVVTRLSGGSVRAWARRIVRWRAAPRFYLYALGLPVLLWAGMNGVLALLGQPVEPGLLAEQLPGFLATLAFVAVLGGGQEEPGWRGFALPRLQERHSPLVATLLLAVIWGGWHLPLYGVWFVVPMLYAVFYTYLYNRTGSVLLCVVLHASITAVQDHLLLVRTDSVLVDAVIGGIVLGAGLLLVTLTRGRLGLDERRPQIQNS
jgi:membrane protease YdiL (CAAX protease family)